MHNGSKYYVLITREHFFRSMADNIEIADDAILACVRFVYTAVAW